MDNTSGEGWRDVIQDSPDTVYRITSDLNFIRCIGNSLQCVSMQRYMGERNQSGLLYRVFIEKLIGTSLNSFVIARFWQESVISKFYCTSSFSLIILLLKILFSQIFSIPYFHNPFPKFSRNFILKRFKSLFDTSSKFCSFHNLFTISFKIYGFLPKTTACEFT